SWLQSVQPIMVIALAPVMAWLWVRLGPREPSSPTKFGIGLLCAGLAFLLLVPAGLFAQSGAGVKVSPLWLVAAYTIEEIGELCLSPVGLSAVTKLAPTRIVSLMMGVFFLSKWLGNLLAGWTAGRSRAMPLAQPVRLAAGVSPRSAGATRVCPNRPGPSRPRSGGWETRSRFRRRARRGPTPGRCRSGRLHASPPPASGGARHPWRRPARSPPRPAPSAVSRRSPVRRSSPHRPAARRTPTAPTRAPTAGSCWTAVSRG